MVFLAIKWLGIAYLGYLAYNFRTSGIPPETVEAKNGKGRLLSSFLAGLIVMLCNPKTMIFYLAIPPTVVNLHFLTIGDYSSLVFITVAVLMIALVLYLLLATS